MRQTDLDRDTQPWYRQPWPWILISIPFGAVVAGIATLIIAIESPNALVVDDYYKAGLAINQEKDHLRLARDLAVDGFLRADDREISFSFTDASNVRPASLKLRAIHATRAELDNTYTLERVDQDRYRAMWSSLPPGNWYFRLEPDDGKWELRAQGRTDGPFQFRMTAED